MEELSDWKGPDNRHATVAFDSGVGYAHGSANAASVSDMYMFFLTLKIADSRFVAECALVEFLSKRTRQPVKESLHVEAVQVANR
jgi:hypothetical protein